jgi:hypothetical protein
VRDNSRQYLAKINKYLFLKDFFESLGGGQRSQKALLRMACISRCRKKWNGVAGTARGNRGEGNAEKQKPEMKMQKPGVTRLLHKYYLLLLGYFLLGYFLFSFRFFLRCHDRLLKS